MIKKHDSILTATHRIVTLKLFHVPLETRAVSFEAIEMTIGYRREAVAVEIRTQSVRINKNSDPITAGLSVYVHVARDRRRFHYYKGNFVGGIHFDRPSMYLVQ